MEDTTDFLQVLEGLQSSSNTRRDPRSIRLAAVVSAMVDVVGQDEISPAKIYASTLTALEGTLEQESRSGAVSDTLATQNALLELVSVTAPYMSPAGLGATLPVSSRVLQGVVTFAHALDTSSSRALETLDELGGINAVLRGVCRAATQILLHVPTSTTEVTVRPLFVGTLLALVEDRRPKVRKAAMNGTCEILVAGSCHAAIRKTVSSYAHSSLSKAKKHQKNHADLHYAPDLLHLLGFLEQGILYLDNRKLQADLMELLMMILQADTSDTSGDYVANFSRKDSTSKLLVVNGILSVILTTLEDESETREEYLNAFSERVAASLLQARPMTVVIGQQCDTDIVNNARTLYGRALISSCTRVLESNLQVGCKLLPLAVQMVIQLSRPCEDGASDVQVSQTLMVELTRLFRLRLMPLMDMHVKLLELDRCMHQCLLGMEPLLQNVFRPTWSVTLQAFAFFLHLIRDKHGDVSRMVQALIELRSNVDFDLMARQAIGDAIGSLIQGVGLESFWGWVTWSSASASRTKKHEESSRSAVISLDRAWLLPLMKTSATAVTPQRPHLEFFQSTVLEMARRCDAYSAAANVKKADAKAHRARVLDLWELFPCFCQSPVDVDAAFPSLAQILMRAMGDSRYPELVTIICSGLTTLARDVSDRIPDNGTGEQDAEVVSSVSTSILPVLFKLVETLQGTRNSGKTSSQANEDVMALEEVPTSQAAQSKTIQDSQRAQIVCETIAELSRLSPRAFVQSLFKKVMQRLLAATQSEYDQSETICTLLGLSQALVHSEALDDSSVSLLYRAVKPFIRTDEYEARVQKKAYKVMFEICEKHSEFTSETERLKELTELLTGSIMTCQVSARHMRLKCMSIIVDGLDCSNKQHLVRYAARSVVSLM
jgi:ribosomal RNA-processing protein 12